MSGEFDDVLNSITIAVDEAVAARRQDEERGYLGASAIGDECDRRLWNGFRWVFEPEKIDGRKARIFRTGHKIEAETVEDLRAAGMIVDEVDPATGRQYAISGVGGHYRGHTDGLVGRIVGVPGAEKTPHLLECKSHNDKNFRELERYGVEAAFPKHAAQMRVYMDKRGLTRALYVGRNKNDERYHIERIKADPEQAMRLEAKAERIITAHAPPPRIRDAADQWPCTWCHMRHDCHGATWARRNCRTCLHSTPELDGNGRWSCALHKVADLSIEAQRTGCARHAYLPELVPGELVDVDADGATLTYRLADGSTFHDGGA